MKLGRMKSVLWRWVALNVVVLGALFLLAYGAGAHSGGLSLLDFGALPSGAGLRLLGASALLLVALASLLWATLRILHPLEQLTAFAGALGTDAAELAPPPATEDDFGFIAENLTRAAEQLGAASADQRQLAELHQQLAAYLELMQRVAAGDLAARGAEEGNESVVKVVTACNTLLDRWCALLANATAATASLQQALVQAHAGAQQSSRTLTEQDKQLVSASNAFAAIPPAVKQVADSAEMLLRAAKASGAAGETATQSVSAAMPQAQRAESSVRGAAATLQNLYRAIEHMEQKLRFLSDVAARANLLALNAGLDLARGGHAGRSSLLAAEQFRDLAQQSSETGEEVESLLLHFRQECAASMQALASDADALQAVHAQLARATQALQSGEPALRECAARAEVVALAASRQADAGKAVATALQGATDLEKLAAQQTRQLASLAEQTLNAAGALRAALASVHAAGARGVQSSSAAAAAVAKE